MKQPYPYKQSEEDWMDALLSVLPAEQPSRDLALRISRALHRRRQRRVRIQLGLCAVLAAFGLWMVVPGMVDWLNSIEMPSNGLAVLLAWLEVAFGGAQTYLSDAFTGLTSLQGQFAPVGISSWPGLIALAISALLLLDLLVPKEDSL